MTRPTVSVIIPTYNRPNFLREAVESVQSQTWTDYELQIVDDSASAAGVSAARNRGIRESRGEWIAFLDDDDLWLPEKLSQQMAFLREHPAVLAVQTEERWLAARLDGGLRRVHPKRYHQKPDGQILPAALYRCLVSPSAVCIRRSVFDEIGLFDETLPACEDYDLWLRLGLRYPVHLLPEPLTVKRGGRLDQLSAQWGLDRYRIIALKKFIADPRSAPYRDEAARVLLQKSRIYAAGCLKRGRIAEAQDVAALQ